MKGTLIIVSGSSGAGKTSIVLGSIAQSDIGVRVITCTTRQPRGGEVDGKDYRFLAHEAFAQKLADGEFVEHAEVYGNFYGTLVADIDAARKMFPIAFLVNDVQGAETIMKKYPQAYSVFIVITRNEFVERLTRRGESPESIATRIAQFDAEFAKASSFDKIIRNKKDRLDTSIRSFLRYAKSCRRAHEFVHSSE